jgi:hypothetical protein
MTILITRACTGCSLPAREMSYVATLDSHPRGNLDSSQASGCWAVFLVLDKVLTHHIGCLTSPVQGDTFLVARTNPLWGRNRARPLTDQVQAETPDPNDSWDLSSRDVATRRPLPRPCPRAGTRLLEERIVARRQTKTLPMFNTGSINTLCHFTTPEFARGIGN